MNKNQWRFLKSLVRYLVIGIPMIADFFVGVVLILMMVNEIIPIPIFMIIMVGEWVFYHYSMKWIKVWLEFSVNPYFDEKIEDADLF